jgi:hypothetical protein
MVELSDKITNGTAAKMSATSGTWNGCLEERKSEAPSATYDFDPIPDDAFDMNLELEPYDDDTSWKPVWSSMYYSRKNPAAASESYYYNMADGKWYTSQSYNASDVVTSFPGTVSAPACPAAMMLMRNVELTEGADDVPSWLTTYINGLVPTGSTYHDIGMIWGGRLTAAEGIFAENVNLDSDKINVSKHIIFMTDGKMEPQLTTYSAYGIETYDHRILPAGSETVALQTARHHARFSAVCEAIKAQGVTIWVISFGTSMTTQLQNCASSGRSYYSSNTTALRNTFKFIASEVADLRLGA